MPNYFTQYWTNRQWDWDRLLRTGYFAWPYPAAEFAEHREARKAAEKSNFLAHTAGNLFRRAGVRPGDTVFIVTVKHGLLHLGGRIVVDRICGQREAAKVLGHKPGELYEAREHIIAKEPLDILRYDFVVPVKIVGSLQFEGPDGPKPLKFKAAGILDQQTLRNVRRLTGASAKLLESLL